MSMRITDECIVCGACEPECPQGAIAAGEEVYVIDRAQCTGCPGIEPPPCVEICPVECIESLGREPAAPPPEPAPRSLPGREPRPVALRGL